jgi:putative DNA primase/helicase
MPILQGDGENGKSALSTDGLCWGLGDYADTASAKLFQSSRSEHSTEQADLRGQRFLIAEEMTEGRALDVAALKRVQDVGRIKARYTHANNFTFVASHSLFCTSNYEPIVSETDHGTWRRLALLVFPYIYRKPGEPLELPDHRRGDPGLKRRLKEGAGGVWDAMVTWAVEGAIRYYADPDNSLTPTTKIKADTLAWRRKADRILGFWGEHLVPDPKACILTTDLLDEFNSWLSTMGHTQWAKETFGQRFLAHTETKLHQVTQTQTRKLTGLSRREWAAAREIPSKARIFTGVRFRTEKDDEDADQQKQRKCPKRPKLYENDFYTALA